MKLLFFCLFFVKVSADDGKYFTNGEIPITETFVLDNGEKIHIFDDVISDAHAYALRYYMSVSDAWKMTSSSSVARDDAMRWKSHYDVSIVANTRIGSLLERIVVTQQNHSSGTENNKFTMTSSYAVAMRRGDVIMPIVTNSAAERWTILLFLNPLWRKNSYGEAIVRSATGSGSESDDVIHVQPRFGRMLLLPARGISLRIRAPSFAETSDQFVAVFHFAADETSGDFRPPEVPPRQLVVLDGLFGREELDAMTSYIRHNHGVVFYDNHLDLDSDNVNWIAAISIDEFVELRMWKIIKENVKKYFDDDADWFPYDVSCNIIRSFDHTRVHVDTSDDDVTIDEVTFLIYLTPDWSPQHYGETIFWDRLHDDVGSNDHVTAVVPLYGRAVAFTGNFPHSALPPSCGSGKLRFSLAVKLLPSRYDAIMKTFEEESRHEILANVRSIVSELHNNSTQFALDESKSIVTSYRRTRDAIEQLSHRAKLEQSGMTSCDHDWFGEEEEESEEDDNDSQEDEDDSPQKEDENFVGDLGDDDDKEDEIVSKFRANMEKNCDENDVDCVRNFLQLFLHQQKERKKQASILLLSVI